MKKKPNVPQNWKEARRWRALDLSRRGWKQVDIAEALGVTPGAVSQWLSRAANEGGKRALRNRPIPGRPSRLTSEQLHSLAALLDRSPSSFGFHGEVWTTKRIATLIKREFKVQYHPDHISRLVRKLGFSQQKPEHKAKQRDEEESQRWLKTKWPRLKKKPSKKAEP
jgi:transposase